MRFLSQLIMAMWIVLMMQTAYSWNAIGHMVIAEIAYQKVNAETRQKIDQLMMHFHQEYPRIEHFFEIGPWPDQLRSQRIELFTRWHYIDNYFSDDNTPIQSHIGYDNAVWAIENMKEVLLNRSANPFERARVLGFMTHIVADLHQPLHSASRVSAQHPEGDKGGNLYSVIFRGETISLHKLWDDGLGMFQDLGKDGIKILAKNITASYPESYFGNKTQQIQSVIWTQEGMTNVQQYVYRTPENKTVSSAYIQQGRQLTQQQVALAGYRLAELLNRTLH